MSDSTIEAAAKASIAATLAAGQSSSIDNVQISNANLIDANAVLNDEQNRAARRSGRRPLFRSLNISGVS